MPGWLGHEASHLGSAYDLTVHEFEPCIGEHKPHSLSLSALCSLVPSLSK